MAPAEAMTEEEYWRRIIDELNELFTLEYIAQVCGVTARQVSNWKRGDRPMGFKAIKLIQFHGKHRTPLPELGTVVRITSVNKGLSS